MTTLRKRNKLLAVAFFLSKRGKGSYCISFHLLPNIWVHPGSLCRQHKHYAAVKWCRIITKKEVVASNGPQGSKQRQHCHKLQLFLGQHCTAWPSASVCMFPQPEAHCLPLQHTHIATNAKMWPPHNIQALTHCYWILPLVPSVELKRWRHTCIQYSCAFTASWCCNIPTFSVWSIGTWIPNNNS